MLFCNDVKENCKLELLDFHFFYLKFVKMYLKSLVYFKEQIKDFFRVQKDFI